MEVSVVCPAGNGNGEVGKLCSCDFEFRTRDGKRLVISVAGIACRNRIRSRKLGGIRRRILSVARRVGFARIKERNGIFEAFVTQLSYFGLFGGAAVGPTLYRNGKAYRGFRYDIFEVARIGVLVIFKTRDRRLDGVFTRVIGSGIQLSITSLVRFRFVYGVSASFTE